MEALESHRGMSRISTGGTLLLEVPMVSDSSGSWCIMLLTNLRCALANEEPAKMLYIWHCLWDFLRGKIVIFIRLLLRTERDL